MWPQKNCKIHLCLCQQASPEGTSHAGNTPFQIDRLVGAKYAWGGGPDYNMFFFSKELFYQHWLKSMNFMYATNISPAAKSGKSWWAAV